MARHTSDDMVGVSAEDQLRKAIKHRDRLLTFAREKEARTVVIDDQGDFYENPDNVWLTDERALCCCHLMRCDAGTSFFC